MASVDTNGGAGVVEPPTRSTVSSTLEGSGDREVLGPLGIPASDRGCVFLLPFGLPGFFLPGAGDPHGHAILQLWDTIDLKDSIQPRSLNLKDRSSKRYAFIIDNRDFTTATERVVQNATSDEQAEPGMAHLIEVATKSPDVCVVLDDRGNMSAWGLESVGCKHRKPGDIFNVAHTDGMRTRFDGSVKGIEDNTQFYPFVSAN